MVVSWQWFPPWIGCGITGSTRHTFTNDNNFGQHKMILGALFLEQMKEVKNENFLTGRLIQAFSQNVIERVVPFWRVLQE